MVEPINYYLTLPLFQGLCHKQGRRVYYDNHIMTSSSLWWHSGGWGHIFTVVAQWRMMSSSSLQWYSGGYLHCLHCRGTVEDEQRWCHHAFLQCVFFVESNVCCRGWKLHIHRKLQKWNIQTYIMICHNWRWCLDSKTKCNTSTLQKQLITRRKKTEREEHKNNNRVGLC